MKWLGLLLCTAALAQVPYERIVDSAKEPGNWLTYSGNYSGHRYSPLAQITPASVANLRVKWAYQYDSHRTEVSPLVVDERLEKQTPMPSYQTTLAPAELDDLVAYLASLRGAQ